MSSELEIRHVSPDDMVPWLRSMRTGLLVDPALSSEAGLAWWAKVWDENRATGAYAGGRCVGTLRTFPTPLAVPIGERITADIPIDALTQVTVAATHRRRGILTRMLIQSLQDAKDRGEVASLLRAAEWPIYGRFGYAPVDFASNYTIWTATKPRILPPGTEYEIVQLDPADLMEPARAVHAEARRQRAGHIDRGDANWQRRLDLAVCAVPSIALEQEQVVAPGQIRDERGRLIGPVVVLHPGDRPAFPARFLDAFTDPLQRLCSQS